MGMGGAPPSATVGLEFEDGPPDLDDPARDDFLGSCRVRPADESPESQIDTSTVEFILLDAQGQEVDRLAGELVDGEVDLFVADFGIANLDSGIYTVVCSAETIGGDTAIQTLDFPIDAGPTITWLSPSPDSALQITPQRFDFRVEENPIGEADDGAAIDEVWVIIEGNRYDASPVPGTPGQYFILVNFGDNSEFPQPPNGQLLVTAYANNSRPTPVTNSQTVSFEVDGEGPVITLLSPDDGDIIGGTVHLRFQIEDDISGVNHSTIKVTLNSEEHYFNETDGRWTLVNGVVTLEFQSKDVMGSVVQTNVQIAARDAAGNDAEDVSALYQRDERPPLLSLAPPYFREGKQVTATDYCSRAFYPTGDAVRGGLVDDLVLFRAAIWDQTNNTTGQTVFHFSGTDRTSAELWIRKADAPLLKDTSGDGTCDDIEVVGAKLQELSALTPTGEAYYGGATGDQAYPLMSIPGIPSASACEYLNAAAPDRLCDGDSDLTVVAHHHSLPAEPVVYAVNPRTGSAECTGSAWELPSALTDYEGWVCAAARAYDRVGNRGISAPLTLCLDNSQIPGEPACASDLGNPPDCTASCSLPADFPSQGLVYRTD